MARPKTRACLTTKSRDHLVWISANTCFSFAPLTATKRTMTLSHCHRICTHVQLLACLQRIFMIIYFLYHHEHQMPVPRTYLLTRGDCPECHWRWNHTYDNLPQNTKHMSHVKHNQILQTEGLYPPPTKSSDSDSVRQRALLDAAAFTSFTSFIKWPMRQTCLNMDHSRTPHASRGDTIPQM